MTSRRTALKALGFGALCGVTSPVSARRGRNSLRRQLADVRSATARYHRLENALDDGFELLFPFVCGEGRVYVDFDRIDGSLDRSEPELLLYGENPAGNPLLGGVGYAVPVAAHPERPDIFADARAGLRTSEADGWHYATALETRFWVLAGWVHAYNPEGVFHRTNPRRRFEKDGCTPPP